MDASVVHQMWDKDEKETEEQDCETAGMVGRLAALIDAVVAIHTWAARHPYTNLLKLPKSVLEGLFLGLPRSNDPDSADSNPRDD